MTGIKALIPVPLQYLRFLTARVVDLADPLAGDEGVDGIVQLAKAADVEVPNQSRRRRDALVDEIGALPRESMPLRPPRATRQTVETNPRLRVRFSPRVSVIEATSVVFHTTLSSLLISGRSQVIAVTVIRHQ